MTAQKYTSHILATSALFTMGNAIALMPTFSLQNLMFSLVLSLVVILSVSLLLNFGQKNKPVFLCTAFVVGIVAAYGAFTTAFDYINFLTAEQLPQAKSSLLALIFIVAVTLFASSKTRAIYKYCLFVFVIIIMIMLVSFIMGAKNFEFQNLNAKFFKNTFLSKDYIRLFLPIVVLPFFNKREKADVKATVYGVAIGFLGLFIAALQTKLTLGAKNNITYPYLKAIGVISSGSLFTRLDGMIWFLFFVCAMIKTTVCVKSVIKIIQSILNKQPRQN